MKKIFLLIWGLFCLITISFSQVTVSGSTGANGTYISLSNAGGALAALSAAGSQAGNAIVITITADLTGETGMQTIGNQGWTSLSITPSGARTVSGSVTFAGVVYLNGAQNVTINGLNTGGNSLTISNSSTSATSFTSTILLVNSSNNTITNCTILGASTGLAGSATSQSGVILLSGAAAACSNNIISNNNIGDAAAGKPSMAIASIGSASNINANNQVTGNNIYNWYSTGTAAAINLGQFNSGWTIDQNRFYKTGSDVGMTATFWFKFIYINTSGTGFNISNNIMGYANSSGTGMLTLLSGKFAGMDITVGTSVASSIQGNTMNNINWTSDASGSGLGLTTKAISFLHFTGRANIGTVAGNTFGEMGTVASATNGIFLTSTYNVPATLVGLNPVYVDGSAACNIANNNIGSISLTGQALTNMQFYGIGVNGFSSHTVSSNTIGGTIAGSITIGGAGATGITEVTALYNAASGGGSTVTIGSVGSGNTIRNITANGTGASIVTGIYNVGTPGTLNINGNNLSGITHAGTGAYHFIYNQGTTSVALNINNNTMTSGTISAGTFAASAGFIANASAGFVTANVSISNNSFSGLSFTGATGGTSPFYCIYNQSVWNSVTINNNNFNNLSLKVNTDVFLCNNNSATPTISFSNNYITTGFTKASAGGNFRAYHNQAAPASGTSTISNNNFSNISIGNTVSYVINHAITSTSHVSTITGNTISNITGGNGSIIGIYTSEGAAGSAISGNTISGITTANGAFTGIAISGSTTGFVSLNCNNNSIYGVSTAAGGTMYGIVSSLGTTVNIYKNKIYDLQNNSSSSFVTGIGITSAASNITFSVYNNLVGDLRAPSTDWGTSPVVKGIDASGFGANSTIRVYYNTVYLNAVSTGANFSTSGIHQAANTTATTGTLDMRNNVVINTSTANGTGFTAAFNRSAGTAGMLNNYATTSNTNLLYAGVPTGNHYIYADGISTLQTIAAYRSGIITAGTIHPRDVNSVTENVSFISISGASANFLHINPAIATQVESGGTVIAGYTNDYDAVIRDLITPDIGADEGFFTMNDLIGPVISYAPLANTACTSPRALTVAMTDATGFVVSPPSSGPRIYFRKTSNTNALAATNNNTTDGWKYAYANGSYPFVFTIDHSLLYAGLAPGDVVEYFVVGHDFATVPNITVYTGVATAHPSSVALTAAAFPMLQPINSYTINSTVALAGIAGSAVCNNYNVGAAASGTYYTDASCKLIARVVPTGGSPVNGAINACVTMDATQQYFNGEPYVQRHYDIEPANTPATATATITLYYTDQEFVDYNTNNPVYPLMPTVANGANGDANRANVRITEFHGTPTGGLPTTTPGNYTGTRILITPGAANVFWNGSYWEVTFGVTGFSGFYAHTTLTNFPLPIMINYLTGHRQGSNHLLNWKVTCNSTPRASMTLERSSDARNYSGLYTITADAARCQQPFDYTDTDPLKGMNYYRLKIVDAEGKVTYGTTVALLNAVKGFDIVNIAPNPVTNGNFKLNVASAQSIKMELAIFDMQGRLVNRQTLSLIAGFNSMPVNVAKLPSGTYTIQGIIAGDKSKAIRFVKQ